MELGLLFYTPLHTELLSPRLLRSMSVARFGRKSASDDGAYLGAQEELYLTFRYMSKILGKLW